LLAPPLDVVLGGIDFPDVGLSPPKCATIPRRRDGGISPSRAVVVRVRLPGEVEGGEIEPAEGGAGDEAGAQEFASG
jgi:hypothetical protein